MHHQVNAVAGRLSLRPPQRDALAILDRVMDVAPVRTIAGAEDLAAALDVLGSEYPGLTDFERDFPSLCFALATGVGKTRLMGAFVAYLHLAHKIDNFFVLAPNLTIYDKLIADFTPGTPKYVFKGVAAFATTPPEIITGDNYLSRGTLLNDLISCKINIFNISKINTEVRGGRSPRIKRLSEYLGQSYFDYLAALPDLVLLMDESHRYRASAGVRAINELRPILGLELTATPYVSGPGNATTPFKNVVLDYPLRRAMEDGFVKEPAVVTRQNFSAAAMSPAELERMKLEDGVRLHEQTKVALETYARERGVEIVKPFVLVIARDTTHAAELLALVESNDFFEGDYAGKVLQVDSSGSGAEKDETIQRLLKVERRDEPTEIVIHVNMLKEGWDVTNLYTIVPLRVATARVLIEQTIGRGLRLPYGRRTGVPAVDTLSIVAHDTFQAIVDEARRPDSPIQLKTIVLAPDTLAERPRTVLATPTVETALGLHGDGSSFPLQGGEESGARAGTEGDGDPASPGIGRGAGGEGEPLPAPRFNAQESPVAKLAYAEIQRLQRDPTHVPDISYLTHPDVQRKIAEQVQVRYDAGIPGETSQLGMTALAEPVDVAAVVERTASLVVDRTISIPRIVVVPTGDVRSGFRPFALDVSGIRYQPISDTLWQQRLRTGEGQAIGLGPGSPTESRPEDHVVSGLVDFDDISYDATADLLYDLAGQVVAHLRTYLPTEEDVVAVLAQNRREIARLVHVQMQAHAWQEAAGYETRVNAGFTTIRPSAFTATGPTLDARRPPADKAHMSRYVFSGFRRCLHDAVKFDSDSERVLALILDRDSVKWFRPAAGQFQITYRASGGVDHRDYQPDFVAELDDRIAMLEPKMKSQMENPDVVAKEDAAEKWCALATELAQAHGGKPWSYHLIPHDAIAENHALTGLLIRWRSAPPRPLTS